MKIELPMQEDLVQEAESVLKPCTGEPLRYAVQSKADFSWYGAVVEQGSWFKCTKASE